MIASANPPRSSSITNLSCATVRLDIRTTAQLLRRDLCVERGLIRMLAGWFLAAPAYETKYAFGYHLFDHAEHADWLHARLLEMRGGQPDANVGPSLQHVVEETLHAENCEEFIASAYLELKQDLLNTYRDHLEACDPSANAAEIRLLQRMIPDLQRHLEWAQSQQVTDGLSTSAGSDLAKNRTRALLSQTGGISGFETPSSASPTTSSPHRFQRPTTILFDARIRIGELMPYEHRQQSDPTIATVEQFKVFFNEVYAAAILAGVLFDASTSQLPWEFFHDFSRHFWDEVRHSEFGATRLKELGTEPTVCNPVLFERSQGLPILHRLTYLTMGLEMYFMPRKGTRVREYADRGDVRSQLFADQDWSDETTHVHFGKRWVNHLLEGDFRTPDDIMAEVREHLERVTGEKQTKIAAPF